MLTSWRTAASDVRLPAFRLFVVFGPRLLAFKLESHLECVSIAFNPHPTNPISNWKKILFLSFIFTELINIGKFLFTPDLADFTKSPVWTPRNRTFRKFFFSQESCVSRGDCDCPRFSVGPIFIHVKFSKAFFGITGIPSSSLLSYCPRFFVGPNFFWRLNLQVKITVLQGHPVVAARSFLVVPILAISGPQRHSLFVHSGYSQIAHCVVLIDCDSTCLCFFN